MLKKAKKSLSFRSGSLYRRLLHVFPIPKIKKNNKDETLSLVTLTGSDHIDMLKECLYSICMSWNSIPDLYVISDGTLKSRQFERELEWWPSCKKLLNPKKCIEYVQKESMYGIHSFCQRYKKGLKIAGISLVLQEVDKLIYCDTDVLWFNSVGPIVNFNQSMCMASDYQRCYNKEVKGISQLYTHRPMNSGVMAFKKSADLSRSDETALKLAKADYEFSDQTFFAKLNLSLGGNIWTKNEVFIDNKDKHEIGPTFKGKNWTARHYVGPIRHLFWRDAFFLRLEEKVTQIKYS